MQRVIGYHKVPRKNKKGKWEMRYYPIYEDLGKGGTPYQFTTSVKKNRENWSF